jgi:hypothetical protein
VTAAPETTADVASPKAESARKAPPILFCEGCIVFDAEGKVEGEVSGMVGTEIASPLRFRIGGGVTEPGRLKSVLIGVEDAPACFRILRTRTRGTPTAAVIPTNYSFSSVSQHYF